MNWMQGAVLAVAITLSGGAAYKFGQLEAKADAADEISSLREDVSNLTKVKHTLELSIAEQNKAVEVALAKEQAANAAKAIAEAHAAQLAEFSKGRMGKLQDALEGLNGCAEVLDRYWELRQ